MSRTLRGSVALLLVLLSGSSCGSSEGFEYFGELGQATPLSRRSWVLWVDAEVDGSEPRPVVIDTGLPFTTFYHSELPDLELGRTTVELAAFGLRFPSLEVVVIEGSSSKICDSEPPIGLLGHDLLHHFDLLIDYRGERITLADEPLDADEPPDVEPPAEIPLEVLGGGVLNLSELQQPLRAPATRLVVEASVEGGDTRAAVVDTGASLTLIRKRAFDKLGGSDRPRLCCVTVALIDGMTELPISRLRQVTVGGVTVENLPVVVFDDDELFNSLATEIGRPVDMLIGGSFLRQFAVEVSYRAPTLRLHRYTSTPHIQADEYVLPGFSFCKAAEASDGMVVLDVYEDSDAAGKGIEPGNLLLEVDGNDVTRLGVDETIELLRSREVGTTARLTFKGVGSIGDVDLDVAVEQMLPDYR